MTRAYLIKQEAVAIADLLNKVTQGDCLEVMREIPDGSVNLIIIDPPYNIGIKGEAWDKYKPEDYFEFMRKVFAECERVLSPNGSFYWFHNDMPQIARLMVDIATHTSLVYNSFITWDKGDWRALSWKNPSEKSNLRSWFSTAEYCLFYTFQDETGLSGIYANGELFRPIKEYLNAEKGNLTNKEINDLLGYPSNGGGYASHYFTKKGKQWGFITKEHYEKLQSKTGRFSREYEDLRSEYEDLRSEYESLRYTHNLDSDHKNIWRYKTENTGKYHACQKPLSVIDRIIKTSSNPGDVVLDCFGGSGTTAVSAVNNDRNYILIEREPEYVDIANKRIDDALKAKLQEV